MYRNLEEDRQWAGPADEKVQGSCECDCGSAQEKDAPMEAGGNKTTTNLRVDWDINNPPKGGA